MSRHRTTPEPPRAPPEPPAGMGEAAASEWRRLAPLATRMGTLIPAAEELFGVLCSTLASMKAAEAELAAGFAVDTAAGGKKLSAAWKVVESTRRDAARLLAIFDLQPPGGLVWPRPDGSEE